jgi:taurine dioxygenase
LDDEALEALRQLMVRYGVIFCPDQHLKVEDHVALGARFGPLEGHPNLKFDTPHPEIFELRASGGGVADEWHSDLTFQEEPALMSILHMKRCPPVGGDTMWSSLTAAYEALSEPMKAFLQGLTALHDALPHNRPDKMTIHPVIRRHPESGLPALYVNEHFTRRIVELGAEESEVLLRHLTRWVQQPRFTVRYAWTEGTIAFWDNRATQHFVLNDFEGERVIQRVTVQGDRVEPFGQPNWPPYLREGRLSATSRHDRQLALYLRSQQGQPADEA